MALVRTSRADGICLLELDRPDKRNALSPELLEDLHAALDDLESDDEVRVVVLGGTGKSFCAGMDLRGVLDDPDAMGGMLSALARATGRIRALSVPVIARVQGAAIGGGCGLAVVADLAISHPEATLGYPEVSLGVCPAVVAPWLLRKIGAGPARAMLLQGGTRDGTQALAEGLIDRLVPRDALDDAALDWARQLATGGAEAMAVTKRWLNTLEGTIDAEVLEEGAARSARIIAGEEAQSRLRPLYG